MENVNHSLSCSNSRSAKTESLNSKKDTHPVPDLNDTAYDYLKASSATDCTGAVPRPPQDSAELDSYLDVYNFLPQCAYTQPNSVEIDMLKNKGQAKSDSF